MEVSGMGGLRIGISGGEKVWFVAVTKINYGGVKGGED